MNTKANLHAEYKTLKNRINVLIFYSKKDYYSKYFDKYSNDIKKNLARDKTHHQHQDKRPRLAKLHRS